MFIMYVLLLLMILLLVAAIVYVGLRAIRWLRTMFDFRRTYVLWTVLVLLPLLFVAVKNRAIDLLRSKKWRGGESGLDELDVCIRTLVADHIEEEFQLSQLSEEIDCCISGLSEQCRQVFLLSRTTGLKNREIAERLNISVKTVEKHIGAALSQLRLRLSRSGFLRLFL